MNSEPRSVPERLEQHQVAIYLATIGGGGILGSALPAAAPGLEHAVNPVLGTLLYVTFLQVPAAQLVRSLREGRFLAAVLVINFVVVPVLVVAMFGLLPADEAVRLGVLLVLLTPCVDYVIVFSGLAGGSNHRLLARDPTAAARPDGPAAAVPARVHGSRARRRRRGRPLPLLRALRRT